MTQAELVEKLEDMIDTTATALDWSGNPDFQEAIDSMRELKDRIEQEGVAEA